MKFLLILFFLFLLMIFATGFSVIRAIFHVLFGSRNNPATGGKREPNQQQSQSKNDFSPKDTNKVFPKEEGEYVDYEEIK